MLWKNIAIVVLQVCMMFTTYTQVQAKSRIMDLFTGITRTSKDVIMGTVGKVREILPEANLMYPDDTVIYDLFDYLKLKMKDPYPLLDVPILDPFVTDELGGLIENDILGNISLQLQEVNITKASEFKVHTVKMNWLQRELNLNVTIPEVHGYATYNINGLLGNMIPVYGNGPMRLSLRDLHSLVTIYMGARNNTYVYIKSVSLDYSIGKIDINMKNLMGGGRFGELLNKVLSEDGPRILDLLRTDVIGFTQKWLSDGANELLLRTNVTIRSVLEFLSVFSKNRVNAILRLNPFKSEL